MNRAEIDTLWHKALQAAVKADEQFTRYHFAELVADSEAKRMHEEGMVTVGHMRDQIAAEREACAKVCEDDAFIDQWKGLAEAAKRVRGRGQS